MSFLTSTAMKTIHRSCMSQSLPRSSTSIQSYHSSSLRMAATLNSENISKITDAEKKISGNNQPISGGPTSQAQSHAGEPINKQTLHDITEGEKRLTGGERPVRSGPTATAQSILTKENRGDQTNQGNSISQRTSQSASSSGRLDSDTISKITEAEKSITGKEGPIRGGPTARAQAHVGEPISSENLHDITEGEKKVTGGARLKGGPTATAQSELSKSR